MHEIPKSEIEGDLDIYFIAFIRELDFKLIQI